MKKKTYILFFLFLLLFSFNIIHFQYGYDFYWHVKIGEYISSHRQIPLTDLFSWYGKSHGLSWVSHEYLFEVLIYQLGKVFSRFGYFLYALLALLGIATILWKQNKKSFEKHPFYTILWALVGMLSFGNQIFPRPHLLSYLFFATTIFLSYDVIRKEETKRIFLAPLITLLWANMHGGSSNLSYLVYGSFFLFSFWKGKTKKQLSIKQKEKLLFALLSSLIVIPINPHGWKMLLYPYQNMTYGNMIHCIEEWQPLNFQNIDSLFYIGLLLLVGITLRKKKDEFEIRDYFLVLIFSILGIKSIRFMPYFYIVASAILPATWKKETIKINLIPIFLSLGTILLFFFAFLYQEPKWNLVSDEIIDYLKENKEKIRLYNSYNLGGYLIYRDIPVFVDGRADMYVDTILCDVCAIEQGKDFSKLDSYAIDTILIEKKSRLETYLKKRKDYQRILEDENTVLYQKIG